MAGDSAYVEESLRLEAVQTNNWVDEVILVEEPIEDLLKKIKPAAVIKGKEFEHQENAERSALESYGGRLIFGSSEVPLSASMMMMRETGSNELDQFSLPPAYARRHGLTKKSLSGVIEKFKDLKVCVVGDLIVDEYITCESIGMSREDPSLVVTPLNTRRFIGGAGIVAGHAAAMGAKSSLVTVTGEDECGAFAQQKLSTYGVDFVPIPDDSRPTTLKQRFRSEGKTLLKVSHLEQRSVSPALQEQIFEAFKRCIKDCDLVVFSDFNYGCLPNQLVERCAAIAKHRRITRVADSQCSSQVGDVSRFKGMSLISATEHEARVSLRDNDDGLTVVADNLMKKSFAERVMIKLGADGVLLHANSDPERIVTNQLPALNHNPVDPAGAGDSMLITSSLALAAGASFWAAAAIGTIAAAIQVGRLGNQPLRPLDFKNAIAKEKA